MTRTVYILDRNSNKQRIEFDETSKPMEGGEGTVFFTLDNKFVLKFYNEQTITRKNPEILFKIITSGPQEHDPEYRLFGWPLALVYLDEGCTQFTGIMMRNVMLEGWLEEMIWWSNIKVLAAFRHKKPERFGDFRGRVKAGIDIADAVRFLNLQGFAQADISGRNFLINPVEGRAVLIDLDGLAVPGYMDSAVLGTPGYMAPELVIGLHERRPESPTILSDRHALAVLLYQLLLINHPLLGGLMPALVSDPEEDKLLRMGKAAVYIEHPTDKRNPPIPGLPTTKILSERLQKLFHRAFVDGLHNPNLRPQHFEYKEALEEFLSDLEDCKNEDCIFGAFATHGGKVWTCPICNTASIPPRLGRFIVMDDARTQGFFSWASATEKDIPFTGIITQDEIFHTHNDEQFLQLNRRNNRWYVQLLDGSDDVICYTLSLRREGESRPSTVKAGKEVPLHSQHQLVVKHKVHGTRILEVSA